MTGVSAGLGLLSVNSSAAPSDFLPSFLPSAADVSYVSHTYAKREELSKMKRIIYGCLVPVLVILSGVFAGLTLGYISSECAVYQRDTVSLGQTTIETPS